MAFWSQADFKEPLRANKWYIEFTSILRDVRFALKECKKPSFKISETKHRCFNYVVNLPGTLTWDPINIKFASVRGQNASKDASVLIYDVLRKGGNIVPNTFLESTISKTRMHNALETDLLNIIQIDSEGIPVEVWSLHNAYISVVNFGSLSYENENIVDIDCTITYDWAELNNQERATRLGISAAPQQAEELPVSEQQPETVPPPPPPTDPPSPPAQPAAETPPAQPSVETPPVQSAAKTPPIASADGVRDPMSSAAEAPPAQSSQPAPEAESVPPNTPTNNNQSPSKEEIEAALAEAQAITKQTRDAANAREDNARNQRLLEDARANEDVVSTTAVRTSYNSETDDVVTREKIVYSNGTEEERVRRATAEEAAKLAEQKEQTAEKTYDKAVQDKKLTNLERNSIDLTRRTAAAVRNKANEYSGIETRVVSSNNISTKDIYLSDEDAKQYTETIEKARKDQQSMQEEYKKYEDSKKK